MVCAAAELAWIYRRAEVVKKDTVLRPADGLTLKVAPAGLGAFVHDVPVQLGEFGLRILEVFSAPLAFEAGLRRLAGETQTPHEWMRLTAAVNRLVHDGVLQTDEVLPASQPGRKMTATEAKLHLDLLRDSARSRAYISALREIITPSDVVVDIGTGNGIVAMAAALAGAKHVYAIEGGPVAATSRRIFEANGLADRITLLEGWSTSITLPEKADVIVSEILSNDIFTENHLQAVSDAARRMLKPGGRLIPASAQLFGRLVQIPPEQRSQQIISVADVQAWRQMYGVDFTPLYEDQWQGQARIRVRGGAVLPTWSILSQPTLIGDVSLDVIDALNYRAEAVFEVNAPGRLDGMIGHFDLVVAPGHTMTTDPLNANHAASWYHETWMCEPFEVQPGDRVRATLTHEYRFPLNVDVQLEML